MPSITAETVVIPTITPSLTPTVVPSFTPTPFPSSTSTPTSTPIPICQEEHGRFVDESIYSELLEKDLIYRVYLPPCYSTETQNHFPVLYLLHGLTYQDDQWDRLGIDEAAEELWKDGEITRLIMVFPYDKGYLQPDQDEFGDAVAQELVPWIDANYRTVEGRDYRALGGLSRGAGWAIHLAFNYPNLFSRVGAHSLALFWTDYEGIPRLLPDMSLADIPFLYLDSGRSDRELSSTEDFENYLTDNRIAHSWRLNIGYHDEDYWSSHLKDYLLFYTQGWTTISQ